MTIAERIERLPLGRFHRRFIALVSLGNFFDLYDIFIVAYIGAALQQSGFLTLRQFTFFVAAGFLGMFVGTVVFGMGSDRMGRRSAFILLLLIYSVFTFLGAFAPTAAWLIALRFFAGVGIGAEIVVIDTYVTEVVPGARAGAVCGDYAGGGILRGAGGGGAFTIAGANAFLDERMALGDGDWGVGGAADVVVPEEVAGVAAVAGEPGASGGSGRDYERARRRIVLKRRKRNLHRGHGERRGAQRRRRADHFGSCGEHLTFRGR